MKNTLITTLLLMGIIQCGVFRFKVKKPAILADYFKHGFPYFEIMPGKIKENYTKNLIIKAINDNKTGCRRYKEDFHSKQSGPEIALMLIDSDNCSLSTKIHYAQQSGASALFLKYIDNKIEEAEVDRSSFEGVRIPIFMMKADDAEKIQDVLSSTGDFSSLEIEMEHLNEIDRSENKIQIYMSSQPNNNPMINFLKDAKEHQRLFSKFKIEINFALGFCKSCKEKNFLRKEPNCLSGGRYCVINSEFRTCEPVLETLRQICIRKIAGIEKLVDYLIMQRDNYNALSEIKAFKEKDFPAFSFEFMGKLGISVDDVKKCVTDSFVPRQPGEAVDFDLDNNTLLQEEQKNFFQITKHNIFPLIIINKVQYDRSINIRDFIRFGCQNHLLDCRGFRTFKRIFLVILTVISIVFVLLVMLFCRRVLKKKMDNEVDIKVKEAIQKYLTVDKV